MKNSIFKLALLASVFPVSALAQNVAPLNPDYNSMPVQAMQVGGEQQVQVQPRTNLAIPRSLQSQVQPQAPQPVDVSPQMVSPLKVLNPSQQKSEELFRKEFSSVTSPGMKMEGLLSEAYGNNPSITAAREGLKAVDEQVFQAYSGFLPKVDFRYNREQTETTPLGAASEDKYFTDNRSLNVTQGIFGGGETYYAVQSAENRVLAARNELRASEQQFLLEAIDAYINYIFTQKVLRLSENNQRVLEEQLKASKERFVVGDATKTDVAQSEARLANANSSRVISEGDFIAAKSEFKKIFGVEAPESLPMPSSLPDIPVSQEEAFRLAYENNPELNQLRYLVESRDEDIDVQQSQLYPQVDVTGSLAESETPTSTGVFANDSSSIGLNVTVPIYNGGVTYSRTRSARDTRNQTKQQYNDSMNTVRSSVIQSWQQIETTQSNLEATKSSLIASEFALQGVKEDQKEGARTILDVLDAEQERFSAEINHARAIKDSVIAIYNLKSVLGELNPTQLGLAVKEYDPKEHYNNTRFKLIGL